MSNQALTFIVYLLGLLSLFSWNSAHASYIKILDPPEAKKYFQIGLQNEFYRSHANYTNFGQYTNLPKGHSFSYLLFKPKLSYSFSEERLFRANIFVDSFYASSKTDKETRTLPFKLSVLGGSLDFYHKVQTLFIGLELTGAYSFHSLVINQNAGGLVLQNPQILQPEELIVGDNSSYFEPSLNLIFKPSHYFSIYTRQAFRYRLNGLSSLLFSDLGVVTQSDFFSAGLSFNSFFSLLFFDSWSHNPKKRHDILTSVNSGSHKFYSVNPMVISGTAWIKYNYDVFDTKFYVNLDTLGKNYGKGLTIGLITSFKFQPKSKDFLRKSREKDLYLDFGYRKLPTKKRNQKKENKMYFQEEEDPYIKKDTKSLELKQELQLLGE